MPFEIAAGFQIAYGTSHLALDSRAGLAPARRCWSSAQAAASA
jgi:hypothetical protein